MTTRLRHDTPTPDVELIEAVCTGSQRAWATFLQRFSGLIRSCVARTLVRSSVSAEPHHVDDAFSDVLAAMVANDYRRLRQYRRDRGCAPSSWVGVISVSSTLDYVRRERRHAVRSVAVEQVEDALPLVPGPDADYETRERWKIVEAALKRCTPRDQEFARLYFAEGLAFAQVAERSGVSVATAYSRRVKLERRLTSLIAEA